jgi:hypothetical protein
MSELPSSRLTESVFTDLRATKRALWLLRSFCHKQRARDDLLKLLESPILGLSRRSKVEALNAMLDCQILDITKIFFDEKSAKVNFQKNVMGELKAKFGNEVVLTNSCKAAFEKLTENGNQITKYRKKTVAHDDLIDDAVVPTLEEARVAAQECYDFIIGVMQKGLNCGPFPTYGDEYSFPLASEEFE